MKKILAALMLLMPTCLFSTTTMSGNLKNLTGGNISSGSFVRFWLRGCAGNQPRIAGVGIIAPSQGGVFYFDAVPNGSGAISQVLYSTTGSGGTGDGEIECGGSKQAVWYGMQVFNAGKPGPEVPIAAPNSGTVDITSVTPITSTPVVAAPSGDTTYVRVDGGNSPVTGPITFKSSNSVLNATQYASGSNTCGIAEAYAAGASTGVSMVMSGDCTISSAQTITTVVQKPLFLNGQGHTITCTHTSGICITLIKPDSTPRTSVVISNLHIVYSGTSASVTGIKLGSQAASATDVVLRDVDISKWNTSGATALELDNAEDCALYSAKLNGNTLALKLDKFTNNNQFFGLNIQGGVQAIWMTDASGNNFIGGLIQSNTGVRTITQTSSTIAIVGNTFRDVWIENNGDTTANSRVFYSFATGTAHNIAGFSSVGNTINAGTNGASGKVYEFAADSTSFAVSPILKGNSYGAYGANIITGTAVFPTSVEGESATFADVGMNLGGVTGLHFWPQTGGHHYQMFAGDSVNSGNTSNWLMKDLTASTTPLLYTASTQAWSTPLGTIGIVIASGTSTFTTTAVGAGACQTTVTTAATNALTTDVIIWDYTSGPLTAATDGMLIVQKYATANNVNFQRCNPTAGSITPTALVINWKVVR